MGIFNSRHSERLEMDYPSGKNATSLSRIVCPKNGNHSEFIRPADLDLHHLPWQLRHETVLKWLSKEMYRTVKVTVEKTSPNRLPGDSCYAYVGTNLARTATGRAWPYGILEDPIVCPLEHCPCAQTLGELHSAFGYLQISTNKHIVYDDFEASHTTIEFFFDSDDDRQEVLTIHGVSVDYDIDQEDTSILHCVYHDKNLPNSLLTEEIWACLGDIPMWVRESMCRHVFVISHPHGFAKRITIGEIVDRKRPWSERSWVYRLLSRLLGSLTHFEDGCVTRYTASTCPGSSGGAVLVVSDKRFCWPISHCAYDEKRKVNVSHSYFR